MQHPSPDAATAAPTPEDMRRVWRADRCLRDNTAALYLLWIRRFRLYCATQGLDECAELTRDGADRFIAWYVWRRQAGPQRLPAARTALYALSRVYQVTGRGPPIWRADPPDPPPAPALLQEYAGHLARHRGNPPVTIRKALRHVGKLSVYLGDHDKTWSTMALTDIDGFLVQCAQHYARTTVADIACHVRSFLRFLFATARISADLADSVIAPVQPKFARPRPSLPWVDVQHLLRAVDTSTARGLRDHALLLMMSTYGLGAGEVIRLTFDDIDWNAPTFRVARPKTGTVFTLPVLPGVAAALASWLRDGRPRNTPTRHLFIRMKMPFGPLESSSAIRHVLVRHARAAGLDPPYLGSHVLRHSNAARHVDLGIRPQVLSDLLGHRDPESISAYVRIATETLRDLALPVPT